MLETNMKLDETKDSLDETKEDLVEQFEVSRLIAKKLNISVENRVIPEDHKSLLETCALVKNYNEEPDDNENHYKYKILRVQSKTLAASLRTHRRKYPDAKIVHQILQTPNSVNLFHRIKKEWSSISKNKIIMRYNSFNLTVDTDEDKIVEYINKLHEERKTIKLNK
jgi:hypothetical protein